MPSAAPATEPAPTDQAPGPAPPHGAELRRLRAYAIAGVAVFLVLLHVARAALTPALRPGPAAVALDLLVAAGFLLFLFALLRVPTRLQRELDRRNRELLALHGAALDIQGDLALDSVLQGVVDRARQLVGARYGALAVLGSDGRIGSFLSSGISAEERERIGPPPTGHGLLGVALHEGRRLRLADLAGDSRAVGFPAHHPRMRSLLAVPIPSRAGFRGNLYLADREDGADFSESDESTLVRFAAAAAIAIDGAGLHERLRTLAVAEERAHLAHELHDGTSQVLAYVNAKAQAVQRFLEAGRIEEATEQLRELAKAARDVYSDVREGILGLRSGVRAGESLEDALARYLETWEQQSGVETRLERTQALELGPTSELQVLRIVQEALANVRKHAAARRVVLRVRRDADAAEVEIRDDGAGFDPERLRRGPLPHFGLATMRERAESIGARLVVTSFPGEGTTVRLSLPEARTAHP